MEKECFEDEDVAKLMNQTFVSIKVDREERPDLDGAYMTVCQVMGRSCGWPLNVIMTPDGDPFFVSSYIPKHSRFGLAGMLDLVPQISDVWRTRRSELKAIGEDVRLRVEALEARSLEGELGKDVLDDAYENLALRFDSENGGFGDSPKFPTPHNLLFLLRYWKRTGEKKALEMVEKTLRSMRAGGIFDQIGLGFHRYSTDSEWLVPHFEKMLYDQALLTLAYADAFQATGAERFAVTIKEILHYVLQDLLSPEGGFYSAEDADTEGEEGKFYLWTEQEIRSALPEDLAEFGIKVFGVEPGGNYFDSAERGRNGKNVLHLSKSLNQLAAEMNMTVDGLVNEIGKCQRLLYEARQKRLHPAKDDKILTDWNGLMIAALARAGKVLNEPKYLKAAVKASDFLLDTMLEGDLLFHRFAKGERAVEGFLDDYAFLAFGLTEVYEADFDEKYLRVALDLTDAMVARFWDDKNGGFYFTPKNEENALLKRKETYDGALPSGNSVALLNLLRLSRLSDKSEYEETAARLSRAFAGDLQGSPSAHTFFLIGLDFEFGPTYRLIIVGDIDEQTTLSMFKPMRDNFLPNVIVSLKTPDKAGLGYEQIDGKATAYVCRDKMCLPPTNSVEKMLEYLDVGIKKSNEKG
jgi:hypothetical protein